jgi:ribosomal protein L34E
VQKSIRTGRATATRRRRQAAARLAFHCAHRISMRFCESPLHLVHGRRTSCVDRVPSDSKKEPSRPLEAVLSLTCRVPTSTPPTGSAPRRPPQPDLLRDDPQ